MRRLTDASAGVAVTAALHALGHDVAAVSDRDPKMPDPDILAWAVADGRLVVTLDKDFGELVYRSGLPHAGVLLLRLDSATGAERARVATDIFTRFEWALPGRFSVYQNGRLRVR